MSSPNLRCLVLLTLLICSILSLTSSKQSNIRYLDDEKADTTLVISQNQVDDALPSESTDKETPEPGTKKAGPTVQPEESVELPKIENTETKSKGPSVQPEESVELPKIENKATDKDDKDSSNKDNDTKKEASLDSDEDNRKKLEMVKYWSLNIGVGVVIVLVIFFIFRAIRRAPSEETKPLIK